MTAVKDLEWSPRRNLSGGEQSIVDFDNGYSASVLRGGNAYTSGGTYEVAVLHGGGIDYSTPITSDVLGYLSEAEADDALAQIEALSPKTSA